MEESGGLRSMGLQGIRHHSLTNQQQQFIFGELPNIMFLRNIDNNVQKCDFFQHLSCDKLSNTLNMFKALCH